LKADPEHYIFSVFGVMHVVPGEENERLPLDECEKFEKSVLSSIEFQLDYLRNSAKFLIEKDNSINAAQNRRDHRPLRAVRQTRPQRLVPPPHRRNKE
jgi:hypothetical protein